MDSITRKLIICRLHKLGANYYSIGKLFRISFQRVSQIITNKKAPYSSYSKEAKLKRHRRINKWRKLHRPELQKFINKMNGHKRRLKLKNIVGSHTLQEWQELKQKFNFCCVLCGSQEPFLGQYYEWLTEDHIIPISKGGTNFIINIQPTCFNCNSAKSGKIFPNKTINIILPPVVVNTFKQTGSRIN